MDVGVCTNVQSQCQMREMIVIRFSFAHICAEGDQVYRIHL